MAWAPSFVLVELPQPLVGWARLSPGINVDTWLAGRDLADQTL